MSLKKLYKFATLFLKLSSLGDIKLQVERAFPPEVYPPSMKEIDSNTLYGDIDENYGLKVQLVNGEIVQAILTSLALPDRIVFESSNINDVVAHYMQIKKQPAKQEEIEEGLFGPLLTNLKSQLRPFLYNLARGSIQLQHANRRGSSDNIEAYEHFKILREDDAPDDVYLKFKVILETGFTPQDNSYDLYIDQFHYDKNNSVILGERIYQTSNPAPDPVADFDKFYDLIISDKVLDQIATSIMIHCSTDYHFHTEEG